MGRWWANVQEGRHESDCWTWLGVPNASGYGTLKVGRRTFVASRFGYEMLVGPIPPGLHLDHLCRNRICVNPNHLEPVTSRENTLRGETLAAKQVAQTHCIHGHELSGDNLRVDRRGKRVCRTCCALGAASWRVERGIGSKRDKQRVAAGLAA